MSAAQQQIRNLDEAKKIAMKEEKFEFKVIEGVTYISFPNANYKEDNGSNPFIACTIEHLILVIHSQ